jgi:hypothetical protein
MVLPESLTIIHAIVWRAWKSVFLFVGGAHAAGTFPFQGTSIVAAPGLLTAISCGLNQLKKQRRW